MELEFTPQALADLEAVRNHFLEYAGANSARQHVQTILHAIQLLKTTPRAGMFLESKTGHPSDYRYLIADKVYLVFYRLQTHSVLVVRILDGRTNYLPQLFESEFGE